MRSKLGSEGLVSYIGMFRESIAALRSRNVSVNAGWFMLCNSIIPLVKNLIVD